MQKAELRKISASRYFEHSSSVSTVSVGDRTERKTVGDRTETRRLEVENSDSQTESKEVSFEEACKDKVGQLVVLSDSMLRGIISKLARDNPIFTGKAIGGAKIEDIKQEIESGRVRVVGSMQFSVWEQTTYKWMALR